MLTFLRLNDMYYEAGCIKQLCLDTIKGNCAFGLVWILAVIDVDELHWTSNRSCSDSRCGYIWLAARILLFPRHCKSAATRQYEGLRNA